MPRFNVWLGEELVYWAQTFHPKLTRLTQLQSVVSLLIFPTSQLVGKANLWGCIQTGGGIHLLFVDWTAAITIDFGKFAQEYPVPSQLHGMPFSLCSQPLTLTEIDSFGHTTFTVKSKLDLPTLFSIRSFQDVWSQKWIFQLYSQYKVFKMCLF